MKIGDIGNREREWDKEGKGESFCLMIFWWPSFSCIAFFSFSWCIFLSFSKWSVSFFFKYIILLFLLKILFILIAPPFPLYKIKIVDLTRNWEKWCRLVLKKVGSDEVMFEIDYFRPHTQTLSSLSVGNSLKFEW